jgi:two-component system, chemotaxis family, protein-glutamate methylesterase/glutaminase
VLLAGGSVLSRRAVRTHLSFDPRFVVVGEARSRSDLVALAGRLRPSAVVLDPDLALGALPALAELMATHPVPVVVYGNSELSDPAVQADLRAAGAVDVVIRPPSESPAEGHGDELRACLRLAARIRVIRHPRGRIPTPEPRGLSRSGAPIVVIGASTGGPSALGVLLGGLPQDLAASVLIVQHMPVGFVSGLAGWLDGCGPLPVKLGADRALLCPGEVLVCPGGQDSLVEPAGGLADGTRALSAAGRLRCLEPQAVAHHVPSVDRAFTSVAATLGPRAIGVMLTGMGRDGAAGMAALHAAGGMTIAQDESTCAIYGMPQAAIEAGAVDHVLALPHIADAIAGLVAMARERRAS